MAPEKILELGKDGVIEPEQIEDFEALDSEIQQFVADGDLAMDDAADLQYPEGKPPPLLSTCLLAQVRK